LRGHRGAWLWSPGAGANALANALASTRDDAESNYRSTNAGVGVHTRASRDDGMCADWRLRKSGVVRPGCVLYVVQRGRRCWAVPCRLVQAGSRARAGVRV